MAGRIYRVYEKGDSLSRSDWHRDFKGKKRAKKFLASIQKKTRSGENKYGLYKTNKYWK